jgi:antitoxin component of RelBE/YafQ-DinJ toxin-antitoxin module
MEPQNKTEYVAVRLTPEVKTAAEAMARDDARTVSDWIRLLIERAVNEGRSA